SCGFPCACCRPLLRAARRRPRLSCVRLNRRSLGAERPCLTSSYLHFSRDAEIADSPMRARSNSSRYQSAPQVILANGLATPSHPALFSRAVSSLSPLSFVRGAPPGACSPRNDRRTAIASPTASLSGPLVLAL